MKDFLKQNPELLALVTMCLAIIIWAYQIHPTSSIKMPHAVAHRASIHQGLPENSIESIKQGIDTGLSFFEVDVRYSADRIPFVFHDMEITKENSRADEKLLGRFISQLPLETVLSIPLIDNPLVRIPSFASILSLIKEKPVLLLVDLKFTDDWFVRSVVEAVEQHAQLGQVVLSFGSIELLEQMTREFPKMRSMLSCKDRKQLEQALHSSAEIIELEKWLTEDAIAEIHKARKRVLINIAKSAYDSPHGWAEIENKNVDFVMTDFADKAQLAFDVR